MPPVLLTRPAPASERLAARLAALGAEPVVSPLLRIRRAEALPELAPGLLFTSVNGVEAYRALGGPPGRPAWCVGPRTARAARAAGLAVRGTAPDAEALARLVPGDAPPLLHLRGAVQRGDLAAELRARGRAARDAVIYAQDPVPLTEAGRAALAAGAVVPLYSPRSAALLVAAAPDADWTRLRPLSLSPAVASMLPVASEVAASPDGAAMWRLLLAALNLSAVERGAGPG